MKLKRIVAAVLAIIMLLALAACGEEKEEQQDDSSSIQEVTENQAKQLAETYIKEGSGGYFILAEEQERTPRTHSISVPKVGSVDISSEPVTKDGVEYYEVTVKGTSAAYDDYGQFIESFRFTHKVYVKTEVYGELTEITGINSAYDYIRCITN